MKIELGNVKFRVVLYAQHFLAQHFGASNCFLIDACCYVLCVCVPILYV